MTDKQILKIATQFTKGILQKRDSKLMCFMVTAPLQGFLSLCGVETELIEGEIESAKEICNHFWLELSDKRILDPTANQLKTPDGEEMPKIYLGEKPEWYNLINS